MEIAEAAGSVRVIAGSYRGAQGPARTFSPMQVWDVRLKKGARVSFALNDGDTAALFVMNGQLKFGGGESAGEAALVVFERAGSELVFDVVEDAKVLLLSGAPFDEAIVGYGPFVMNSEAEIRTAIEDYRSGRMGHISVAAG